MSNMVGDSARVTGARVGGQGKGRKVSMCSWFNAVTQCSREQFWRLWQVVAVYI